MKYFCIVARVWLTACYESKKQVSYPDNITVKFSLKRLALLVLIYCMSLHAFSQLHSPQQQDGIQINSIDSTFELYLLIGQSNMAGRGEITKKYARETNSKVLMLDKENKWVPAKHPLHFDKPSVAGVGPGLSFGIAMAKKNPSHKIGLIPCAVGGTSISVWKPGAYDQATKTHPFDDMLVRLQAAQKTGVIKGVLWLQGESDSSPEKTKNYLADLETLINRIRVITNNPLLPFVAGELGRYKEQYQIINNEINKLPEKVENTAVACSKKFIDKGDSTHFNSASAEKYGKRFAKKMLQLQKRKKIIDKKF